MSIVDDLTVMVLTFNEAPNIGRTLEALKWVPRILVIDSGSTDDTLAIVSRYPQARIVQRKFDTFAGQCNFGLSQLETEWVLSIDADYVAPAGLEAEVQALSPDAATNGYFASFVYCIYGRPLRATLYPPRCILYRTSRGRYRDEGHGHRLVIAGTPGTLTSRIAHDDRKPLSRWLSSQQRYAAQEAQHLLASGSGALRPVDRIRRMACPAPPLVFIYTLIVKGCILDGWPGWYYALQRLLAETMIAIELIDRRLADPSSVPASQGETRAAPERRNLHDPSRTSG